MKGVGK